MSFHVGSRFPLSPILEKTEPKKRNKTGDEWGEKPDEYVRLTDALRAWCNGNCTEEVRFCDDGPCPGVRRMLLVERVEIVRCKDCIHHHYQDGIPYCDQSYWGWKDDDYCSRGERKEEQNV